MTNSKKRNERMARIINRENKMGVGYINWLLESERSYAKHDPFMISPIARIIIECSKISGSKHGETK